MVTPRPHFVPMHSDVIPSPLALLPTVARALDTCGPDARAIAEAVARLMPPSVDRGEVYRDLLDKLRTEMWPEPLGLAERSRLAVIAWRALPLGVRGIS